MTKYYCDVCGKEVKAVEKYTLPDLTTKDIKHRDGTIIKKIFTIKPTEMEICKDCATDIFNIVKGYAYAKQSV